MERAGILRDLLVILSDRFGEGFRQSVFEWGRHVELCLYRGGCAGMAVSRRKCSYSRKDDPHSVEYIVHHALSSLA